MSQNQPLVLVDVDGVLADFESAIIREANRLSGMRWTANDIRTWEVFDSLSHPEFPELRSLCYSAANQPGWCAELQPFPEAVEVIERLRSIACVLAVTSPFFGLTWEGERRQWLAKHFGFKRDHVIQTKAKWAVHGDFLIDDKPDNVTSWASYPRCKGVGILWDPNNRHADFRGASGIFPQCQRVSSWEDVFKLIPQKP